MYYPNVPFADLVGKTITAIENTGERITFACSEGSSYQQIHHQDCCESVSVEDIAGDLEDLVGSPIVRAEERSNTDDPAPEGRYADAASKWTFYELATIKGSVTIRWYGTSNGYYSTSVSFEKVK